MHRRKLFSLINIGLAYLTLAAPLVNNAHDSLFDHQKFLPFVPSPQAVVDIMVELAGVKNGDLVYDLGSVDGRIVVSAAQKGDRAVGFEIEGDLVKESRANTRPEPNTGTLVVSAQTSSN